MKLFTSFFVVLAIFASTGQAEAQFWGSGGLLGGFLGGNEALRVTAANQAMIWSLANPWQNPYQQLPLYPQQYPYPVQQVGVASPQGGQQVVCTPKPRQHQERDVIGGALLGAGLGALTAGGKRGAIAGGAAGAGGGLLATNHEQDCQLVQPTVQPAVSQQGVPGQAPSGQASIVVKPMQSRLAGVRFMVVNEHPGIIMVETPDGHRVALAPRAQAEVSTPDVRVFTVQPNGQGSFDEFEIDLRGTEDPSLPGWRIPASVRLKEL